MLLSDAEWETIGRLDVEVENGVKVEGKIWTFVEGALECDCQPANGRLLWHNEANAPAPVIVQSAAIE